MRCTLLAISTQGTAALTFTSKPAPLALVSSGLAGASLAATTPRRGWAEAVPVVELGRAASHTKPRYGFELPDRGLRQLGLRSLLRFTEHALRPFMVRNVKSGVPPSKKFRTHPDLFSCEILLVINKSARILE